MVLLLLALFGALIHAAPDGFSPNPRGDGGRLCREIDEHGVGSPIGWRIEIATPAEYGGGLDELLASQTPVEAVRRFAVYADRDPEAAFLILARAEDFNRRFADHLLTFEYGRGRDFRQLILTLNHVRTHYAESALGTEREIADRAAKLDKFDFNVGNRLKRRLISLNPGDYANAMDDMHVVKDEITPRFWSILMRTIGKATIERCALALEARAVETALRERQGGGHESCLPVPP